MKGVLRRIGAVWRAGWWGKGLIVIVVLLILGLFAPKKPAAPAGATMSPASATAQGTVQPTPTIAAATPTLTIVPTATSATTLAPTDEPTPTVEVVPTDAPAAAPATSGIVCSDGYLWPGTTHQGACRGHGGIRK